MTTEEINALTVGGLQRALAERGQDAAKSRNKPALRKRLLAACNGTAPAETKSPKPRTTSRMALNPHDVGIGKTLTHAMRSGRVCECKVLASGFKVKDTVYSTLSAAAAAASGQQWNGAMFWGLIPYPKHKKPAKS